MPADVAEEPAQRMDEQGAERRHRDMQPHPPRPLIALAADVDQRQAHHLDRGSRCPDQQPRDQQQFKAGQVKPRSSGKRIKQRGDHQHPPHAHPLRKPCAKRCADDHGKAGEAEQLLDQHRLEGCMRQLLVDARQHRIDHGQCHRRENAAADHHHFFAEIEARCASLRSLSHVHSPPEMPRPPISSCI